MANGLQPQAIADSIIEKQHPRPSDVAKTSAFHFLETLTQDREVLWNFNEWLNTIGPDEDVQARFIVKLEEMSASGQFKKQKEMTLDMDAHAEQIAAMSALARKENRPLSLTEKDLDFVYASIREIAPAILHERLTVQAAGNGITPEGMPGVYDTLARAVASGAVINVVFEAIRKHFADIGLLSQHRVEYDAESTGKERSNLERDSFLKTQVEEILQAQLLQKY